MKRRSRRTDDERPTVEDIQGRAQAFRHRRILLGSLVRELDLRFGRSAEEPDFLYVDGGYEPARRDVVQHLRGELILAQGRAHSRYRELIATSVDAEDGSLIAKDDPPFA